MTAEKFVELIEEMVDLKLQKLKESELKPSPELASILAEKRMTDARRLTQIRTELIRMLDEASVPA